jgi:hypothetical protein
MNAALYFELVDAVAKIDGAADIKVVTDRIAATPMHPLERRVLERALRARAEAIELRAQLLSPDLYRGASPEMPSQIARG